VNLFTPILRLKYPACFLINFGVYLHEINTRLNLVTFTPVSRPPNIRPNYDVFDVEFNVEITRMTIV